MVGIHLGHGVAAMAIYPWWQVVKSLPYLSVGQIPDYEWASVKISGRDHARELLGHGQEQAWSLRRLVSGEGDVDVSRLSDHQVIALVADKLAQQRWILFKLVLAAEARAKYTSRAGSAPSKVMALATSPSSFKIRQVDAQATQPAPAVVEADFESVDQDAQAATLRLAAANGVPFCAVCEKAKQALREARLAVA